MYKQKKQRVELLTDLELLLCDFEKRLHFSAVPIREWLLEVALIPRFSRLNFLKEVNGMLSEKGLETAWQMAVEKMKALSTEDITALKVLGTHLGKSDALTQIQCVKETRERISENKHRAAKTVEKAQKLYVSLGTCVGMALALLLI